MSAWAVCLLNWNGREDTLRCLDALRELAASTIVVVADNGSEDGSVEAIRAAHPEVELIENGANLGFSGGYNRGDPARVRARGVVGGAAQQRRRARTRARSPRCGRGRAPARAPACSPAACSSPTAASSGRASASGC